MKQNEQKALGITSEEQIAKNTTKLHVVLDTNVIVSDFNKPERVDFFRTVVTLN